MDWLMGRKRDKDKDKEKDKDKSQTLSTQFASESFQDAASLASSDTGYRSNTVTSSTSLSSRTTHSASSSPRAPPTSRLYMDPAFISLRIECNAPPNSGFLSLRSASSGPGPGVVTRVSPTHSPRGDLSLVDLVALPAGIDAREWLVTQLLALVKNVTRLYDVFSEFCTPTSCPAMSGPSGVNYLWADSLDKLERSEVYAQRVNCALYLLSYNSHLLFHAGRLVRQAAPRRRPRSSHQVAAATGASASVSLWAALA